MSAFREYFSQHVSFREEQHLFYQTDLVRHTSFEDRYIGLRTMEGRLYPNEVVKKLPEIHPAYPLAKEWRIRKRSADRLAGHLRKKKYRQYPGSRVRERMAYTLSPSLAEGSLLWDGCE